MVVKRGQTTIAEVSRCGLPHLIVVYLVTRDLSGSFSPTRHSLEAVHSQSSGPMRMGRSLTEVGFFLSDASKGQYSKYSGCDARSQYLLRRQEY